MECPHLRRNVLIKNIPSQPNKKLKQGHNSLICQKCDTSENLWICLCCGTVGCGRYINGHAKAHYESLTPTHCVCMDCDSYGVYCYQCDEFVVNDTVAGHLEHIRKLLQDNAMSPAQLGAPKDAPVSGSQPAESPRSLRHRRAARSLHINPADQSAAKRPRVADTMTEASVRAQLLATGLTNLGNTCFMNAVLQSLSHLQQFCMYILQLPAFADVVVSDANRCLGLAEPMCGNVRKSTSAMDLAALAGSAARAARPSQATRRSRLSLAGGEVDPSAAAPASLSRPPDAPLPPADAHRPQRQLDNTLLVDELGKTLAELCEHKKHHISPQSLFSVIWKVVPRFRGFQQQDAHEFMCYLLERLHMELVTLLPAWADHRRRIKLRRRTTSSDPVLDGSDAPGALSDSLVKTIAPPASIVTHVFSGTLQSEVVCLNCKTRSVTLDPFWNLSLDIPQSHSGRLTRLGSSAPATPRSVDKLPCRLTECLKSFTEVEVLDSSELWVCRHCRSRQPSTKKFWIRKLPNVLCLHLKRFRWSATCRQKVETWVDFPLRDLDMTPYLWPSAKLTRSSDVGHPVYHLCAVIVHHGSGVSSGHYTAFAFDSPTNSWLHFNDSRVQLVDERQVADSKAYILFYERTTHKGS